MPSDTSPKAAAHLAEIFRRMTPEQRLQAAFEASEFVRELALTGIRARHPEFSEKQVRREWLRLAYGFVPPR